MDDSQLDTLLRRSAPHAPPAHPAVDANVLALVADADRRARPARIRRRALWIAAIPAVPALVFGLTAGIEARLAPDLVIPVAYTTDTGVPVSCSIDLFNGEVNWVEVSFGGVDYLRAQDWTGIGERIYSAALVHEVELTRLAVDDPAAVSLRLDGVTAPDAATIERMAWSLAENDVVESSVPESALGSGGHFGSDSDCTGQLH